MGLVRGPVLHARPGVQLGGLRPLQHTPHNAQHRHQKHGTLYYLMGQCHSYFSEDEHFFEGVGSRGEDPAFARFGSGDLYLEQREIFEIVLNEYFR